MAPDNERLERLIETAFDRVPEPAPARLSAVEQRLVAILPARQNARRRSGWYWWLVASFVATGAAAWWGGEYFGYQPADKEWSVPERDPATETPSQKPPEPTGKKADGLPNVDASAPDSKPTTIYRRERY